MKLWLIVPIKPFAEGKSRLAGRLSPSRRSSLSKQLFRHVITQALAAPELTGILVVSRDATVLDDLQAPHLYLIAETGNDLNRAIQQGREEALQRGADAILVLPADLPYLQSQDITTLYQRSVANEGALIVPSDDNGTNALLLRPPQAIDFAFGQNSFLHHCRAAQMANLPVTVIDTPHLSFDVDLPPDLAQLSTEQAYQSYVSASSPQAWR